MHLTEAVEDSVAEVVLSGRNWDQHQSTHRNRRPIVVPSALPAETMTGRRGIHRYRHGATWLVTEPAGFVATTR